MRCEVAAVRAVLTTLCFLAMPLAAQPALSTSARASATGAFDALLEGMACRQHKSGRMDCEFRVGSSIRFIIAGVGQEDVIVSFVQADSGSEYVVSMVPLHGCVVVKPTRTADATRAAGIPAADSVVTFAFVSPKTGKVYRNWAACLSATRSEVVRAGLKDSSRSTQVQDSVMTAAAQRIVTKRDSATRADSAKRARAPRPPR